jgi:hypothetical protein
MPEHFEQFASSDGYVYIFDIDKKVWAKYRTVSDLPLDVKKQVHALQERAETLKDALKGVNG